MVLWLKNHKYMVLLSDMEKMLLIKCDNWIDMLNILYIYICI